MSRRDYFHSYTKDADLRRHTYGRVQPMDDESPRWFVGQMIRRMWYAGWFGFGVYIIATLIGRAMGLEG